MTEDDNIYTTATTTLRSVRDEAEYRVEALRLASHSFAHQGAEVVVAAADDYLDFLLDDGEEFEEFDTVPSGEQVLARLDLSDTGLVYLGVLLATALATGRASGVLDDNAVAQFGNELLRDINDVMRDLLEKEGQV